MLGECNPRHSGGQGKKILEFESSLGYTAGPWVKKKKQQDSSLGKKNIILTLLTNSGIYGKTTKILPSV